MIEEDGYFLRIGLTLEEMATIPEEYKHTTKLGDFMLLGNEKEISLLEHILFVDLSDYCFDWFIVSKLEEENTNGK
tara:strand:- start:104463 stop:104690 length:228 start_codon:yes stop_codon:yes gene_type:complete